MPGTRYTFNQISPVDGRELEIAYGFDMRVGYYINIANASHVDESMQIYEDSESDGLTGIQLHMKLQELGCRNPAHLQRMALDLPF